MRSDRSFLTASLALLLGLSSTGLRGQNALTDPYAITFDTIQVAETQMYGSIVQLRFGTAQDPVTGADEWIGLVENLHIAPPTSAPGSKPRFDLSLAAPLGLDTQREALQTQVHQKHRAFLHNQSSFRVHNASMAALNYSILFMSAEQCIGRPAFRVCVLPNDPTANIWVLDLDVETGYPLNRSEYTPEGDLVGMLAVVDFQHGPMCDAACAPQNWWSSSNAVEFSSATAAHVSMTDHTEILLPTGNPAGFTLQKSSVITNALTGDETLALEYTDGIRTITMLETAGQPQASLPTAPRTAAGPTPAKSLYAIFDFSDVTSRQLMFQVGGTRYIVLGGSKNLALEDFAEKLLRDHVTRG